MDIVCIEKWGSTLMEEFSLDEEEAGKYAMAMKDDLALQEVKKVIESLPVGLDIFHTSKGKSNVKP